MAEQGSGEMYPAGGNKKINVIKNIRKKPKDNLEEMLDKVRKIKEERDELMELLEEVVERVKILQYHHECREHELFKLADRVHERLIEIGEG
jgi:uncharacterized protein YjgD (DUF1641 family)